MNSDLFSVDTAQNKLRDISQFYFNLKRIWSFEIVYLFSGNNWNFVFLQKKKDYCLHDHTSFNLKVKYIAFFFKF